MPDYSQGKARQVAAPTGGVVKGQPARVNGWNGVFLNDAAQGVLVAMAVDSDSFYYIITPAGVSAAIGDLIYITAGGVLSATASGNTLWGKTEEARDSNGVTGIRIINTA